MGVAPTCTAVREAEEDTTAAQSSRDFFQRCIDGTFFPPQIYTDRKTAAAQQLREARAQIKPCSYGSNAPKYSDKYSTEKTGVGTKRPVHFAEHTTANTP